MNVIPRWFSYFSLWISLKVHASNLQHLYSFKECVFIIISIRQKCIYYLFFYNTNNHKKWMHHLLLWLLHFLTDYSLINICVAFWLLFNSNFNLFENQISTESALISLLNLNLEIENQILNQYQQQTIEKLTNNWYLTVSAHLKLKSKLLFYFLEGTSS